MWKQKCTFRDSSATWPLPPLTGRYPSLFIYYLQFLRSCQTTIEWICSKSSFMDVMIFNFHMEGKQCHGDLVLPIANFRICCIKFVPLSNEALLSIVPAGAWNWKQIFGMRCSVCVYCMNCPWHVCVYCMHCLCHALCTCLLYEWPIFGDWALMSSFSLCMYRCVWRH